MNSSWTTDRFFLPFGGLASDIVVQFRAAVEDSVVETVEASDSVKVCSSVEAHVGEIPKDCCGRDRGVGAADEDQAQGQAGSWMDPQLSF